MLKNGTYAAWFKTPLGHGTGIAHVADGRIWGRDSIMTYSGSCQIDGDRFTAVVLAKRHTEGHATVFGVDDLTLRLEGTCIGKLATYVGTADEAPGMILEGTLILSEQVTRETNAVMPALKVERLRKLPKLGR